MVAVRRSPTWIGLVLASVTAVAAGSVPSAMAGGHPSPQPAVSSSESGTSTQWQSELFFHRADGLYRAYDPSTTGELPKPMISGSDWPQKGAQQFSLLEIWNPYGGGNTGRWAHRVLVYDESGSITVQVDPITYRASGYDEALREKVTDEPGWDVVAGYRGGPVHSAVLAYRGDGTYLLRGIQYTQPTPGLALDEAYSSGRWTSGWTSIVPIDLNGDGDDELLFYRAGDGLFRYYDVRQDGTLPRPLTAGKYTTGWSSITAVDLDGDGQDEIMFYRSDGLFRFYDIRSDGTLAKPMAAGDNYSKGWGSISRFEACRPDPTLCG